MPLFRFGPKLIFFVHIPKTGGSSIERALQDMGGLTALLNGSSLGFAKCTPQHMHAELLMAFVDPDTLCDMTFTVVRDPLARLISEYKMRRSGAMRREVDIPEFSGWVEMMFERYRNNRYLHDNHLRPQSEFITAGTTIFRLEDGLENPLSEVARCVNAVPPSLRTLRQSETQPIDVPNSTKLEIAAFYAADYAMFGYEPPSF